MAMKVQVISKETIKPSSPTPHHLKTFNLSLLDQLTPPVYVRTILFYAAAAAATADIIDDRQVNGKQMISDLLKRSLSETLTRFYPVAGRLKDNIFVDCNDEGVDYFEARVNVNISDFMSSPNLLLNHLLLPSHIVSNNMVEEEEPQLVVQVNMFDCGGIAISVCMSHKIADASTITTFINCWAATARGDRGDKATEIVGLTFDSASLFPPRDLLVPPSLVPDTVWSSGSVPGGGENKAVVSKRFLFEASKIAALRARIWDTSSSSSSSTTKYYPTRVEAVSALIWKSAMEVTRMKAAAAAGSLPKPAPVVASVVNS